MILHGVQKNIPGRFLSPDFITPTHEMLVFSSTGTVLYNHVKIHIELCLFNSYSAGIDFRRQNVTSVDVRFWRLKTIPA